MPISQKGISYVLIILLVAIAAGGFLVLNQTNLNNPTKVAQNPSPSPDETANWQTYTDPSNYFSFKYPANWEIKKDQDSGDKNNLFVGPKVAPCPSDANPFNCEVSETVLVGIIDNPKDLSIEEFDKQHFSDPINYQPFIVGGLSGKRTQGYSGMFETDSVVVNKDKKIYSIEWSKNYGRPITLVEFETLLSTFKFLDSNSDTSIWKTLKTKKFSFQYPSRWFLEELTDVNFYELKDNQSSPNNKLSIFTEDYSPRINQIKPQELFEEIKNQQWNANKGYKSFGQELMDKQEISIDKRKSMRYTIKLNDPKHLTYNKLNWVLIINGTEVTFLTYEGDEDSYLEKMLATFKFLD